MDLTDTIEEFRRIGEDLADLEDTILRGWPSHWETPNDLEAQQIEALYHELGLHLPGLAEAQRWDIAGNTVARFRRDITL